MAHVVIIQSVTTMGDVATCTGTVDGTPVTINCWKSALTQFATALLAQAFIANQMVAAAIPSQPTSVPTWNGTVNV